MGATENRFSGTGIRYNSCAYTPPDKTLENFVLGWVSMIPVTKIATAGKIVGGSLAVKGVAAIATGGGQSG